MSVYVLSTRNLIKLKIIYVFSNWVSPDRQRCVMSLCLVGVIALIVELTYSATQSLTPTESFNIIMVG